MDVVTSESAWGLSPRGRGNLLHRQPKVAPRRSIPAWAGEPSVGTWTPLLHRVYPRVGGGTVFTASDWTVIRGLSPRGRGNRSFTAPTGWSGASIPAWAGEPPRSLAMAAYVTVYPRVGGGTQASNRLSSAPSGLSPRGRGNRGPWARCRQRLGSIPAWAGEPATGRWCRPDTAVYPRVGGGTRL